MYEERIKEIFSDEAFLRQLFEQENPEQVQALLAEKEVDVSIDEIIKLRELIEKHMNGELNLEELSEEELEKISGGGMFLGASLFLGGMLAISASGFVLTGAIIHRETSGRW